MIIGEVGKIGARDEEEVRIGVWIWGEGIVEMEGMFIWGRWEGMDVGLLWVDNGVEIIDEVMGEVKLGTSTSTVGMLVVASRIGFKFNSEKEK